LVLLERCKFEVFLTLVQKIAENRDHFTENLPETLLENLQKQTKHFALALEGRIQV